MAMDRPRTIGDAPASRAGAQRRTPLWRLSCLARNGRKPRGRKSHQRRCGSDDRGEAGLRPDQAIKEATCVRVLNRNLGRRLGESRLSCTRGRNAWAQKAKRSAAKGGIVHERTIKSGGPHHQAMWTRLEWAPLARSTPKRRRLLLAVTVRPCSTCSTCRTFPNLFDEEGEDGSPTIYSSREWIT